MVAHDSKSEESKKHWIDVLRELLKISLFMISLLVGIRTNAVKSRYISKMEKEIKRKKREERNKSNLEREYDMAK